MTWETEDNLPAFTADSTECSKCKVLYMYVHRTNSEVPQTQVDILRILLCDFTSVEGWIVY